jgi:ankyrin repeat protein
VFCQLDRLRRCLSPRIRRALDELPETLDETYERTLLDMDDENWEYAHRLFQCIVVARRPLHVEELAGFLTFKSEEGGSLTFEENWRPENPRDTVLSTCSSLISIVNVDGPPVIQFSHFSVKEYLTSTRIAEGRVSRYYIPLEPAHLLVIQACLSILLRLDEHVTKESIQEFPLARYAAQYWADHAEFGDVSSRTEDMIEQLFSPENHHFANWVWIYDTFSNGPMDSEAPSRPLMAPLHYAARHGLHRAAEWLITTCSQDVNVSGLGSLTPLHIASEYGRFKVAQVLLKHHADVNAGDVFNEWAPLHFVSSSAEHNKPEIARLLLEHGADANSKTDMGITPLLHVLQNDGNPEVAQMLLEHGADPDIRSTFDEGSLYVALKTDHLGLAQLLLKHGADPSNRNVDGQTPLHVASRRGDLKVAQGLLELGVDVNSLDSYGQTPLQMALQNDKEQVVQLLLKHGAERT